MEGPTQHVIHLYEFQEQSVDERQLTKLILETLAPHLSGKTPEIKIKGRSYKYFAEFRIDPDTASKLSELKTVRIGTSEVYVGRYYHDYQIFLSKLPSTISKAQVADYFNQKGQVVDVVIADPVDKKNSDLKNCYVKMKDDASVDRIILERTHKIEGKDVRPARNYGFEENKESDKKLFLKIEGAPASLEELEQKLIELLIQHGKLRERPRVELIGNNKYKMIIIFVNAKDASDAINSFPASNLVKELERSNLKLSLTYFHTKQNKIFVGGLKDGNEKPIREAFEKFGTIDQFTLTKGKNNIWNAVIGFKRENDYKMALATSNEQQQIRNLFANGKPYVTIYMTNEEKKSYHEKMKTQYKPNFIGVSNTPAMNVQFPFGPQLMNPGVFPNKLPMPMPLMPPPNIMQNAQMQGQFPQGNNRYPKQGHGHYGHPHQSHQPDQPHQPHQNFNPQHLQQNPRTN